MRTRLTKQDHLRRMEIAGLPGTLAEGEKLTGQYLHRARKSTFDFRMTGQGDRAVYVLLADAALDRDDWQILRYLD